VHGRPIELVTQDDGYDVKRALSNVDSFLADPNVFAFFNCMGTPMINAMLPRVAAAGMPFFAPFSGALSARPANLRNVFPIRPSYPEEAVRLVEHLATIGIREIAIGWQNNAFGREIFDGTLAALRSRNLPADLVATVENDGSDAQAAASRLLAGNPQVVVVAMAGLPAISFIRAVRMRQHTQPLYALSVMGSAATLKTLGEDATSMVISQVTPSPSSVATPVVRDYLAAQKALGSVLQPSYTALEGYINARVFVEALRHAGPNATRASFIQSTWGMGRVDLGGFDVRFTEPGKGGSRFIELTLVGKDGRFVK
jgi:ABC-type branched-subunit amino acid transport system substrate-binding protein